MFFNIFWHFYGNPTPPQAPPGNPRYSQEAILKNLIFWRTYCTVCKFLGKITLVPGFLGLVPGFPFGPTWSARMFFRVQKCFFVIFMEIQSPPSTTQSDQKKNRRFWTAAAWSTRGFFYGPKEIFLDFYGNPKPSLYNPIRPDKKIDDSELQQHGQQEGFLGSKSDLFSDFYGNPKPSLYNPIRPDKKYTVLICSNMVNKNVF